MLITYGKWGTKYRRYLIDHDNEKYYILLCSGELYEHIAAADLKAERLYNATVQELMRRQDVTPNLKRKNPEQWQKIMNKISRLATEIVMGKMTSF